MLLLTVTTFAHVIRMINHLKLKEKDKILEQATRPMCVPLHCELIEEK